MEIQSEFETDLILAAFRTPGAAAAAMDRLVAADVRPDALRQATLAPGRYILSDTSAAEEVSGAVRGVEVGLPVGAVAGLGYAASVLGGSPELMATMAGAGAFAGGVLGAIEGAILRTRYDDDVNRTYDVAEGQPGALLILHTSGIDGTTTHAHRILTEAGAVAFLDPSTFEEATTG